MDTKDALKGIFIYLFDFSAVLLNSVALVDRYFKATFNLLLK